MAYLVDRDPKSIGGDAQRRAVVRLDMVEMRYPGQDRPVLKIDARQRNALKALEFHSSGLEGRA